MIGVLRGFFCINGICHALFLLISQGVEGIFCIDGMEC